MEEGDIQAAGLRGKQVGVCAGGAQWQFPATSSPFLTCVGPKKVFQLSKESGIGRQETAVCGGGHVTN